MRNVSAFIKEAGIAPKLYHEAQCQALLRDASLTASDLSLSARLLRTDPDLFQRYLDERSHALSFAIAAIVTSDGDVLRTASGGNAELMAEPQLQDFEDATARQPRIAVFSMVYPAKATHLSCSAHRRHRQGLFIRGALNRSHSRTHCGGCRRLCAIFCKFRDASTQHRTWICCGLHHARADNADLSRVDGFNFRKSACCSNS